MTTTIIQGDVLERLADMPDESVQCVVTSPPYWGLRDYGVEGQLGLEKTPGEFVAKMVEVFRQVRRVMRGDATLWLNLGDSYCAQPAGNKTPSGFSQTRPSRRKHGVGTETVDLPRKDFDGLKPKDLIGMPWRLAFALQADGWWLRSDIIWEKPNPMPESVTDRPTKSHEHVFLLTKRPKYFYDATAVREKGSGVAWNSAQSTFANPGEKKRRLIEEQGMRTHGGDTYHPDVEQTGRSLRDVWTIPTQPMREAHFACYPEKLVEPCIKAGTSEKGACECGQAWTRVTAKTNQVVTNDKGSRYDVGKTAARDGGDRCQDGERCESTTTGWQLPCNHHPPIEGNPLRIPGAVPCVVLDPFCGSGTTLLVAKQLGRSGIGIELNPEYVAMAERRIRENAPLFAESPADD